VRIIAGTHRSRPIGAPKGRDVRPTSDRARESLFSILGTAVRGVRFLDLFAGSGAVGLEALSRGAARAVFVEREARAAAVLSSNLASLDMGDRGLLLRADWLVALDRLAASGERFGLIFADPPYDSGLAARCLLEGRVDAILEKGALLVIEHRRTEILPEPPAALFHLKSRVAGEGAFSIYRKREEGQS
jgi:16S rRNA (guanine966-N2)-methyltransferase